MNHGTRWAYEKGCRCDACRAVMRDRARRHAHQRKLRAAAALGITEHGDRRSYRRGCRCRDCRAAWNAYCKANKRARVETLTDDKHGTMTGYSYGCRCDRCKAANTAAQRVYVAAKRDEINAQRRARRLKDPERFRAVEKAWRDANIEKYREQQRLRYHQNPEKYRVYNLGRSQLRSARWTEAKILLIAHLGGSCIDCGITDPRVLHFDHRDPADKVDNLPDMVRKRGIDSEIVWAEVAKCDLRCANCHTIKTFEQGDYFAGKRRQHPDLRSPDLGDHSVDVA